MKYYKNEAIKMKCKSTIVNQLLWSQSTESLGTRTAGAQPLRTENLRRLSIYFSSQKCTYIPIWINFFVLFHSMRVTYMKSNGISSQKEANLAKIRENLPDIVQ